LRGFSDWHKTKFQLMTKKHKYKKIIKLNIKPKIIAKHLLSLRLFIQLNFMRTIPPAETFIINKLDETQPNSNKPPTPKQVEEWMIEFAKMHVTEALKEAKETLLVKAYCNICNSGSEIDFLESSILDSYPLHRVE